jgi:Holliday junction resolvasome RuvABC endonuclease subunit
MASSASAPASPRKIVALDPSYTRTGYAVIEDGKPVAWGAITFPRLSKAARRAMLKTELARYLDGVDFIVVEQLWSQPGASIIAACADAAYERNLETYAFHSRAWKKRILGAGNADKKASVLYVKNLTGWEVLHDVADAICVGLAAAQFPEMLRSAE